MSVVITAGFFFGAGMVTAVSAIDKSTTNGSIHSPVAALGVVGAALMLLTLGMFLGGILP
jgi:hypothetical protein